MRNRPLAAVALVAALAAGWTSASAAPHPAAVRGTNTIVSQGSGRQVLEGGGLIYGALAPGGVIRFVDLSPRHDGKYTVTAQVPATDTAAQTVPIRPTRQSGYLVFKLKPKQQNANLRIAFSVAGSKFRLVLDGQSIMNGAGVTGHVSLTGTGTVAVNGQTPPLEWVSASKITLATPPKAAAKPTTTATKPTTTATTTKPTTTATTTTSTTSTTS